MPAARAAAARSIVAWSSDMIGGRMGVPGAPAGGGTQEKRHTGVAQRSGWPMVAALGVKTRAGRAVRKADNMLR